MLRLAVVPDPGNGLPAEMWLMVDEVATIRRTPVGRLVGRLAAGDTRRLDRALLAFLGIG